MPTETRIVRPGPEPGAVVADGGQVLRPPADWRLLPPGDATLTRRVKAGGPSWTVQEKRGRRTFSGGVWAPAARIDAVADALEEERRSEGYQRRRAADLRRRETVQARVVEDFEEAVLDFLAFPPVHAELAGRLARAVTVHATPVGSGTVARTARIPLPERAAAAVMAWMRHHTTGYESMAVARVKGERRRVRRRLAARSRAILDAYRTGAAPPSDCPLARALTARSPASQVRPAPGE